MIHPRLAKGGKLGVLAFLVRMLPRRVPDYEQWERDSGQPMLNEPVLAQNSSEWCATAERQELNLLPVSAQQHELVSESRVSLRLQHATKVVV